MPVRGGSVVSSAAAWSDRGIPRYDVAQTDGEPLPTLAHDTTGDPGIHLAALEQAITDAGVVITRLADLGGAHGYSQPGRIAILESLTSADTAAVLVHEFAHLCSSVRYVRSGSGGVGSRGAS
jgi:hypothetical protein